MFTVTYYCDNSPYCGSLCSWHEQHSIVYYLYGFRDKKYKVGEDDDIDEDMDTIVRSVKI